MNAKITIPDIFESGARAPGNAKSGPVVDLAQFRAARHCCLKISPAANGDVQLARRTQKRQIEKPVPGVPGVTEIVYPPSTVKTWRGRCVDPVSRQKLSINLGRSDRVTFSKAIATWESIKAKVATGHSPRSTSPTLSGYFDGAYTVHAQVKKRSFPDDVFRFNGGIRAVIGDITMEALTGADLQRCIDSLHRTRMGVDVSSPLKTSTINRFKALLKAIMALAYRQDVVERNVAKHLVMLPENNFRHRVVTAGEYPRLGAAVECAPFKVASYIKFILATGLRSGEALNATFASVDRANAVLHLALTKNGRSHKAPLSPTAMAVIDELEAARCNEFLFPSASGVGPMSRPGKAFKKILADAGITGLTLHDLRRSVATEAIRSPGVTILDVSRLLNHSSVRVTEERYLVACNDRMLNAATQASSVIAARMRVVRPVAMLVYPTVRSICFPRTQAFIFACAKQA